MKKNFFRSLPGLLKTTFKRWNSHDPFREGAVIAYSAIFSLPGLLVMVITLVGYFFGTETVSGRLHLELAGAMGKNTADQIQQMIMAAMNLYFAFSLATISVVFALMFKFLPDAKIKWPSVWIGAITTSLLFVIGKAALGLYFGKAHPGSGYGAAGSVVLILLWASYSSMIVFFGAEFTKVYSDEFHGKTAPSEHAVSEPEKEPAKEPARIHAREHARQNRL